jgi:hypothetical protein
MPEIGRFEGRLARAVGYYPDQVARLALWHFGDPYVNDEWVTYMAFAGLLNFPEPDTSLCLVGKRLVQHSSQTAQSSFSQISPGKPRTRLRDLAKRAR